MRIRNSVIAETLSCAMAAAVILAVAMSFMPRTAQAQSCPGNVKVICPDKLDPFVVQFSAAGDGSDLTEAKLAAKASIKKRASLLRKQFDFPIMTQMFLALTHRSQLIPEEPEKPVTTATLGAWFHLDFDNKLMTSLPIRCVPHGGTAALEEHKVVHCEGY